ncbi:MAG: pilus (MSHA type) biogenesis protein MshL [Thiogranum sp.]|nr:pilus (MSHA type) biogenesis protein MshL [Thiogranum sp.]
MNRTFRLNTAIVIAATIWLGACQTAPGPDAPLSPVREALRASETPVALAPAALPPEIQQALMPPASSSLLVTKPPVPTFNISVSEISARQFFMSLVEGTSENMVVHPEVSGTITLDLKNVTTEDVMSTVRDVYGYDYRLGRGGYQVFPAHMRSQVFKVDYLDMRRKGGSSTRVSSGQITDATRNGRGDASAGDNGDSSSRETRRSSPDSVSGAQVTTRTDADFWYSLKNSLNMIIGEEQGRKIITNPMSGTVVVRALPRELMVVEQYLNTLQNAVSRQVIIEAKILEVQLNDSFQSGVNWNALIDFGNNHEILLGQRGGATAVDSGLSEFAGDVIGLANPSLNNATAQALGGVFAIQADLGDFNALIELLRTQGDVQVLSSPRVSTVNNQKAIIKVGTDEYFVTDVGVDTDTTSGVSNKTVDIQLTPFFSGVALDVTPQIDESGGITLHVHPAISEVTADPKELGLTTESGTPLNVPLARSTIRESDTIIRARNGQVVVIGGLMQDLVRDKSASTPFLGDIPVFGHMFRHTRKVSSKTELVILLRPVLVESNQVWSDEIGRARERFDMVQHPDWP